MEIALAEGKDLTVWEDLVSSSQEATIFHRAAWAEIIATSSSLKPRYLCARVGGEIVGVLPLIHAKSAIFGNHFISTPFCMRGGPIGSEEAKAALIEHASELAKQAGADSLEIRAPVNAPNAVIVSDRHCYFAKRISKDNDENMKAIPRKQRAMVRKGIKAGLTSKTENDIEIFYKIYATSVRDHGTPIFSKKYFQQLKNLLGDDCRITTVYKDDEAISSVMSFRFRNTIMPYYGGGLAAARHYKAFDFMYWQVMSEAAEQGIEIFDYGRSKIGAGSFNFKKNWGFEPEEMSYTYSLIRSKQVPHRSPASKKYHAAISTWRKLPLAAANRLGPFIAPYFA